MPDCDISVAIEDEQWRADLPQAENLAMDAATRAINAASLPEAAQKRPLEVSIVLADNDMVQALNRDYRKKDKPTNVLSFALLDDPDELRFAATNDAPLPLGDIILARETVMREADAQDKRLTDHFRHLVVHGVLHLLGYDHIKDSDAVEMETLERKVLDSMGIDDPYDIIKDSA